MRVGCTLPTFRQGPDEILAVARDAEEAGLDGLFVFEHLWPMGQPGLPAILGKPALAAAGSVTSRIALGTLVARVGLMPDTTALAEFAALALVAGDRLIAGLGMGDHKSDDEQRAYGIPLIPAAERRQSLGSLARTLALEGVQVWVGAGSTETNAVARSVGAVLNLWEAPAATVAAAALEGPTSWGGPLPSDIPAAADKMAELADAGAAYLVWGWPASIELVVGAIAASGIDRT